MISYPGDILARFGRYEAVEDLGHQEQGHLWRAWDPFLERYVRVAALPGLDPAELHRAMQGFDGELGQWLGDDGQGIVLDFGPSGPNHPAFFVFQVPESAGASHAPAPDEALREWAPADPAPKREWMVVAVMGAVLLLVVLLAWARSAFGAPPPAVFRLHSAVGSGYHTGTAVRREQSPAGVGLDARMSRRLRHGSRELTERGGRGIARVGISAATLSSGCRGAGPACGEDR